MSLAGAASGADLDTSSNYSSETLERRRGQGYLKKGIPLRVSRS